MIDSITFLLFCSIFQVNWITTPVKELRSALEGRFAYQAESLLDLACGRGGDIWKWMAAEACRCPY